MKIARSSFLPACAAAAGLVASCSSPPTSDDASAAAAGTAAIGTTHEAWHAALSERAQRGLAVSPVPIDTAGLSNRELERIGEGSYLVNAAGDCTGCHTADPSKFLGGGNPFPLDDANVVYTRNLTPDPATGLALTEAEFVEALRTGKDFRNDGQMLVVMPWLSFRWLSTADLRAIYAYLRAIPPVSNAVPPDVKEHSILNGAPLPFPCRYDEGEVVRDLPPEHGDPNEVRRGLAIRPLDAPRKLSHLPHFARELIGRGSYLATVGTCNDCHTNPDRQNVRNAPDFGHVNTAAYLSGGHVFDVPPPLEPVLGQRRTMTEDLTGATHGFLNEPEDSLARFLATIDSGKHVDETPPRALGWPMPWQRLRNLLFVDKVALYAYLKTIPPRTGAVDKETQEWAPYCASDAECATKSCNTATNECVGNPCASDTDCFACQMCSSGACVAPSATSTCATQGI